MNLMNGRKQFSRWRLFEQVAGRAGSERVEDVLGILINSQHDDLRRRENGLKSANTFDPVQTRQVDVHQDDIGIGFGKFLQGAFGGRVLGKATIAGRAVDELCKTGTDASIILNNGNGDTHEGKFEVRNSKPEVGARSRTMCVMV